MDSQPSSRPEPSRSASRVPSVFPGDEPDSGIVQISDHLVLLLAKPADDVWQVVTALESEGFAVVPVSDTSGVDELRVLPRLGLIETGLPGALELLKRVGAELSAMHAIALLGPDEAEGPALAAGASLTLRRPLVASDVVLCLQRLRAHQELLSRSQEIFEGERGSAPSAVIEGVLATIGHEIMNPLSAALASMECLHDVRAGTELDPIERRGAIDDTVLALRRIQHVVTAVSSLVKGSPPMLERAFLWAAAERAVAAVRRAGVSIEVAGDRDVRAWASPQLMEQVIVNLVQNALDATRETPNPQILVRIYQTAADARISVRDNGPGVPVALRQRIFDPFFTTKGERGSGLGLVLVRHAVLRMGGTLSLGPSQRGAVFRVRLRLA